MGEDIRTVRHPGGRTYVLAVPVDAWQIGDLVTAAVTWGRTRAGRTIMYANVHVMNTAYEQPRLQRALARADTVYCDGSGVRIGAFMLGSTLPPRMTGADWIEDFCAAASRHGTRVFILAGAEGVAPEAARVLTARHPGLLVVGTHNGYLADPAATASALRAVAEAAPEVVFVGMGTPLQELWVTEHREQLGPRVVWCVGALFDFVAGVQRRGPRWLVDHHMEWAARLLSDPRRLWKRYVVGNPLFLARVARQRLRRRAG